MSATSGFKPIPILRRLSRVTTPGRQLIPQIDGLRFIAIMTVMAFHVWSIGTFHLKHAGGSIVSWVSRGL